MIHTSTVHGRGNEASAFQSIHNNDVQSFMNVSLLLNARQIAYSTVLAADA